MPRLTPKPAAVNRALSERLQSLRERMERAAQRAGRDPSGVRLVAVTKGVGTPLAAELVALGQLDLGESRVQELERKASALAGLQPAPHWHLIGHLQTNKARRAVELAARIHSVDSPRLIDTLDRLAGDLGRRPRIYLEVNSTGGAQRSGVRADEIAELVEHARRAPRLELAGLMTLAPVPDPGCGAEQNAARARAAFRALAQLAAALPAEAFAGGRPELSMGMSSDFEEAILAGADWLRIGSALFEGLEP